MSIFDWIIYDGNCDDQVEISYRLGTCSFETV